MVQDCRKEVDCGKKLVVEVEIDGDGDGDGDGDSDGDKDCDGEEQDDKMLRLLFFPIKSIFLTGAHDTSRTALGITQ